MKTKYLLTIIISIFYFGSRMNAQSVTVTKVLHYLKIQKQTEIQKDLIKLGFTFNKKNSEPNLTEYSYYKKGRHGMEKVNIASNDELFSIIYKPESSFYNSMKEIMLNKDFAYAYTNKSNKYFESSYMRIGINDETGIISFFVKLN